MPRPHNPTNNVLSLPNDIATPPQQLTNSQGPLSQNLPFNGASKQKNIKKLPTRQQMATTEEEIAAEFSKAQIKTLKAKMKEQESSLKDLEFQNSYLSFLV